MQHVHPTEIRHCIFKEREDFEYDVQQAFGNDEIEFMYSLDGVTIVYKTEPHADISRDSFIDDREVCKKLSAYYGVEISSFHLDDYDDVGVWIVCHGIEEEIFRKVKNKYDTEDVTTIIDENFDTEWMDEPTHEKFLVAINIKEIVDMYQRKADAEYGVWDNIRSIINCYFKEKIEDAIEKLQKE